MKKFFSTILKASVFSCFLLLSSIFSFALNEKNDTAAMPAPAIQTETAAQTEAVVPATLQESSVAALSFELWNRQNYESRKRQEITGMLARLLGPDKASVFTHFDWLAAGPAEAGTTGPARVTATVVLDKSVAQADASFVRDMVVRLLELNAERGDQLEIYQMPHRGAFAEIMSQPQNILDVIKFLFIVLLVFIILSTMTKASRQINESLERLTAETKASRDISVQLAPKVSLGAPAASPSSLSSGISSGGLPGPFSRVDPAALSEVLEGESSRAIALFVSALDPEVAGRVMAQLAPSKQEEVALTISQMESEPDPREVAQLQAQIQLKLRKFPVK